MNFSKKYRFLLPIKIIIIALMLCQNAFAESITDKTATISVSGSHSVLLEHDLATIHGSIKTYNLKAKDAVQENAVIIQKVKDALKDAGLDPKKLYSSNYSLTSNYDYNKGQQIFRNYQVTHDISISTKDLDQIGILADLLTNSGVNHISQIAFSSSNSKQAYDQALKNAVLDARNKAQLAISGIDNLAIGKAVSIHVNQSHAPSPPIAYDMAEARVKMASSSAPTQLQTEGQTINVKVQTSWEITSK